MAILLSARMTGISHHTWLSPEFWVIPHVAQASLDSCPPPHTNAGITGISYCLGPLAILLKNGKTRLAWWHMLLIPAHTCVSLWLWGQSNLQPGLHRETLSQGGKLKIRMGRWHEEVQFWTFLQFYLPLSVAGHHSKTLGGNKTHLKRAQHHRDI